MPANPTDRELAVALANAEMDQNADDIIEVENKILARLNVPLSETEQGLTHYANEQIREYIRKHAPELAH